MVSLNSSLPPLNSKGIIHENVLPLLKYKIRENMPPFPLISKNINKYHIETISNLNQEIIAQSCICSNNSMITFI